MRAHAWRCLVAAVIAAAVVVTGCRKSPQKPGAGSATFRTSDGFVLEGRTFGSGTRAVVLAHMYPADQTSWSDFAVRLADDGYLALTFNFRGYGASQGDKDISVIDRDVLAAVAFMKQDRSASGVVLVGASMGGTSSLIAASQTEVAGVATLSAPAEFMGLDAGSVAGKISVPTLYIAAHDDGEAVRSAETLYGKTVGTGEIEIVAGSDHGTDLLKGKQSAQVREKLLAFIKRAFQR